MWIQGEVCAASTALQMEYHQPFVAGHPGAPLNEHDSQTLS